MTLYTRQQKRHRYKEQTFGLCFEKARVGWFERIALKHLYYHMWNRWPVQVWCMKQGTESQCTGTTHGDGLGREGERGLGWGTHVHLWLIHANVCQKPPQYCKVISLQLNKSIKKIKPNTKEYIFWWFCFHEILKKVKPISGWKEIIWVIASREERWTGKNKGEL